MKISNDNKTLSFKTGLTYQLMRDFRRINVKDTEADFAKIGIDANFLGNKFICGSSVLTANVLGEISSKYKLPFDFLPPAIRAYKENNLNSEHAKKCHGFCNVDTKKVLKDEPSFIGGSIFLNDTNKSALKTNFRTTIEGMFKICSSSHFLHTFFHEWFHSIHQDLIYKNKGYEGNCPVLREKYFRPDACGLKLLTKDFMWNVLLNHEKEVESKISSYAIADCCSASEIFAELMAKITLKSLDKNLNPTQNPLDNMPKGLPKSVTNMVEELLNI